MSDAIGAIGSVKKKPAAGIDSNLGEEKNNQNSFDTQLKKKSVFDIEKEQMAAKTQSGSNHANTGSYA